MNDPVQTETSTQDNAPSEVSQPVAQETAPPADNQPDVADAGAGSTAEPPPHEDAPADKAQQPPLDNSKSVASNTQSQPEAIDPEAFKRLRDEKSSWGRQMAEARRQQEQMRSELVRFQQERERAKRAAEAQKLALHDYRHPEHQAKFQPILAKADSIRQQLADLRATKPPEGLTPEQLGMWQKWQGDQEQRILSRLTDDEQVALEQFQKHSESFKRNLALNPAQALGEFVTPMLEQFWQRKQMETQASAAVDQDLNDPIVGPVLKEFQPQMMDVINKLGGTDEAYDFAKHHALVYAQNKAMQEQIASLKRQLGEAGVKAGAAATQQQLAKGKASITRDVVPRHTKSPYEIAAAWASKNGVEKGSPQFFQHLREIEAEQAAR